MPGKTVLLRERDLVLPAGTSTGGVFDASRAWRYIYTRQAAVTYDIALLQGREVIADDDNFGSQGRAIRLKKVAAERKSKSMSRALHLV